MEMWPERYVNLKVQEHEERIRALAAEIQALKSLLEKPKRRKRQSSPRSNASATVTP